MTKVRIHDDTLTVSFTTTEKVAGLLCDQRIPAHRRPLCRTTHHAR